MKNTQEIWKDAPGYEKYYSVSNNGRIRSKDRYTTDTIGRTLFRRGRIRKLFFNGSGYLSIRVYMEGNGSNLIVHRTVAKAFIPNPFNKSDVNHKDLNKANNKDCNLEWLTHQENVTHAVNSGCLANRKNRGIKHRWAKLKISDINRIHELMKIGLNYSEIGRCFNVSYNTIRDITNRKTWQHLKIDSKGLFYE